MNAQFDFRIEPATERDLPIILHMIRALAVVIGYAGDEPAGFAVFFHTFSTFLGVPGLYLEDLFVESRFRGRGFGKKLLAFVAHQAVTRGCNRFEWAALDWNEPALEFYRGLGARQRGEWIIHRLSGGALVRLSNNVAG